MSDASKSCRAKVEIVNRLGLHARAATLFVETSSAFASEIAVSKGSERVDGKSIIALMTLAAGIGSEIEIETSGDDAQPALAALCALVANKFNEPV